jgi:hypothetical protein
VNLLSAYLVSSMAIIPLLLRLKFHSFAFISSSSPAHGVPEPGSSWAKHALSQFELAAWPCLLPLIGSGTASLQSLLRTWLINIRAIWTPRSSSFGVRSASKCWLWAYFTVYETKGTFVVPFPLDRNLSSLVDNKTDPFLVLGVSLEQVNKLLVESTPRKPKGWVPTTTFASGMGLDEKDDLKATVVEDVNTSDSAM